ncbi:MAG: carbon storage regulator CsrA [Firmicutes bacterium]|nr:carbon storage regulator CsrA [Bacillota bacterium]
MLVLSRKLEESLIIDEDIEIVVIGIEDGKVKLGINAPKDKKIFRKEVLEEIKKENKNATEVNDDFLKNL